VSHQFEHGQAADATAILAGFDFSASSADASLDQRAGQPSFFPFAFTRHRAERGADRWARHPVKPTQPPRWPFPAITRHGKRVRFYSNGDWSICWSAKNTTAKGFAEWSSVFGDAKDDHRPLDRLDPPCHIVEP